MYQKYKNQADRGNDDCMRDRLRLTVDFVTTPAEYRSVRNNIRNFRC